eukprot:PLAT2570.1.p1 GENE.PLAT2570.1~~PLAT2570.1.p1  ORF type:complete len:388 (+),score=124.59 PLAT2570.1:1-1164(+)
MTPASPRLVFGTARLAMPGAMEALKSALHAGVRWFDCGPAFHDAERLLGAALTASKLPREQLHLVGKVGVSAGLGGALQPAFSPDEMSRQLDSSLQQMNTDYLDIVLLQSPEALLQAGQSKEDVLSTMSACFTWLDSAVRDGRIRAFGLSSSCLAMEADHPLSLPYKRLPELTDSDSFSMLQLPVNVLELGALDGVIPWASSRGMDVMARSVLNAQDERGSWRLASAPPAADYDAALSSAMSHFQPPADPKTAEEVETAEAAAFLRQLLIDLDGEAEKFSSVMHWEHDLMTQVMPMLNSKLAGLDETSADTLAAFFQSYGGRVREKTSALTRSYVATLGFTLPDGMPLDEYAIRFVAAQPGVTHVAVGLTKQDYVQRAPTLWELTLQ